MWGSSLTLDWPGHGCYGTQIVAQIGESQSLATSPSVRRGLGTYGAPKAPFWTTILNQISHLVSSDARISPRDARKSISPRLVNATDAAAYLGYASTEVLKHLPIKPLQLNTQGPGSAPRWDLRAIDEMLNASSGLGTPDSGKDNDYDSPKALLGAWRAKRGR